MYTCFNQIDKIPEFVIVSFVSNPYEFVLSKRVMNGITNLSCLKNMIKGIKETGNSLIKDKY